MSVVRTAIRRRVQAWLKATGSVGGALTDAQIIPSDDKGPRPPLPYVTVKVLVWDIQVGTDEGRDTVSGSDPLWHMVGHRRATVSLQSHGAIAAGWLERAHRHLRDPSVLRTVLCDEATGEGVSLTAIGGLTDVSAFLDSEYEDRCLREYTVSYAVSSIDEPTTLAEALEVEATVTYDTFEGDPDAIVRVQSIT